MKHVCFFFLSGALDYIV